MRGGLFILVLSPFYCASKKKTDYLFEILLLLYMIRRQQIFADAENLISDNDRPLNVLFYEYNGIVLFDEFQMPFIVHDFFHLAEKTIFQI